MTYADYINQEFEKYAQTRKAIEVHDQVMKYAKGKYQRYLVDGDGSKHANEKIIDELRSSMKQKFPRIVTLPKKGSVDSVFSVPKLIVLIVVFLLLTIPMYLFAPLFVMVPHIILILFVRSISIDIPKKIYPNLKKYFFTVFGVSLLLFQLIMMIIKYPTEDFDNGITIYIVYGVMILIFIGLSTLMTYKEYKYKERGFLHFLVVGPNFEHVETYLLFLYLVTALGAYLYHAFIIFMNSVVFS
ncbi:hypothetical protein OAO42_00505 [Candidatus Izimaplasma bacterium]|nr:hypothetical protein [Candidatus Izimaplasma bacterium]